MCEKMPNITSQYEGTAHQNHQALLPQTAITKGGRAGEASAAEGVEKLKPLHPAGGNEDNAATVEYSIEFPGEIKTRTAIWCSNHTPEYFSKGTEIRI
jgi:hypothetical protein